MGKHLAFNKASGCCCYFFVPLWYASGDFWFQCSVGSQFIQNYNLFSHSNDEWFVVCECGKKKLERRGLSRATFRTFAQRQREQSNNKSECGHIAAHHSIEAHLMLRENWSRAESLMGKFMASHAHHFHIIRCFSVILELSRNGNKFRVLLTFIYYLQGDLGEEIRDE